MATRRGSAMSAGWKRNTAAQVRCGLCVLLASLPAVTFGGYAGAGGVGLGPAAGQLDGSFGTGGKIISDLGQGEYADAVLAQPDGKIVVAGSLAKTPPDAGFQFLAARYSADGHLDPAFGSGGTTTISPGVGSSAAHGAGSQRDGKILLVGAGGYPAGGNAGAHVDFALARLTRDGRLDASFGQGGTVNTDLGGTLDSAVAVAQQPDGKIVVAGSTRQPGPLESNPYGFAVARYNADGSLDAGFGANGHTSTNFADGAYVATGVALQPDGKIVVAGWSIHEPLSVPPPVLKLVRYQANGTLDPTFGHDGRVTRADSFGQDVAVVHGKIVVGGGNSSGLALWRYNADGTPDTKFGFAGVATAPGGSNAGATRIAIQPDGEIVAAGSSSGPSGHADFAVARFNPNGRPDSAFGTGGIQTTNFGGDSDDVATGLALTDKGKIVLAGYTFATPDADGDVVLARYSGAVCVVPDVLKLTLLAARRAMAKAQCAVGNVGRVASVSVNKGRVVSQKPAAGTRQRLGASVALVVSKGKHGS